ncbi:MAG: type II secretion system F family protein [Chloroflexi bacterium]|nr:type II secretion system F family protein [Chloroflexota bacterium]
MLPILVALLAFAAVLMVFIGLALPGRADPLQSRLNQFGTRVRTLDEIEMERPFSERVGRPMLQSLSGLALRFAPRANVEGMRLKLEMSGNPYNWLPTDFLGVRTLAAVVCAVLPLGLMLVSKAPFAQAVLYATAGGGLGFYLPVLWLNRKIAARQKTIQRSLPDALDLLTISVEAGLALDAGLARVAEKMDNELARAFGRVNSEVRMGRSRKEALKDMAERAGVSDLSNFVTALIQAEQLGVSMTKILRVQSEQMRIKRRQRAEEEAHKAPTKMSVVLVLLLIPGLFIVILGPTIPRLCRQFNMLPGLCG